MGIGPWFEVPHHLVIVRDFFAPDTVTPCGVVPAGTKKNTTYLCDLSTHYDVILTAINAIDF